MSNGNLRFRAVAFVVALAAGLSTTRAASARPQAVATTAPRAGLGAGVTCGGDCNADAVVRVNELVTATNIATGTASLEQCPSADTNVDLRVTVDELVGAVGRALNGCPEAPATASPTTSVPLPTETVVATAAMSASATPSPTNGPSATTTTDQPATETPTATLPPMFTSTSAQESTATETPTPEESVDTGTATPVRSTTRTRTPSRTRTASRTPTATRTATITRTPRPPTRTPSPIPTRTPSVTRTPSRTRTGSATPRASNSPTPTRTPRPTSTLGTPGTGPLITYFGIVRADGVLLDPTTEDGAQRPVFERQHGQGMIIVLEARPGTSNRPVGDSAFEDSGFPDLQLLVSQPLGDGRADVCDIAPPDDIGGVPSVPSLSFDPIPAVIDAANDLGCRVDDGTGHPLGRRNSGDACTRSNNPMSFGYGFVHTSSAIQFCLPVADAWKFQNDDTIIAARARDTAGNLSAIREIVVRVGN